MLFKMYRSPALLVSVLLCLPLMGHAETGGYIGIDGGFNYADSQRLKQNGNSFVKMEFKNDLQDAYVYGVTAGWKFALGFRPELEISASNNELDQFSDRIYDGNGSTPATGRVKTTQYFANLWYDFPDYHNVYNIQPYVGAGMGQTHVSGEDIVTKDGKFDGLTDDVFGYQFGAGLRYPIIPNLISSFDLRYVKTGKINFGNIPGLPPANVTTQSNSIVLKLGLSYFF
jgi:opacity protein-like surface antigen